MSIAHTQRHKTCLSSMHVESYLTRAEIQALPYCADTFMTSKTSNLEKHVK
jgi:hypothetical protein